MYSSIDEAVAAGVDPIQLAKNWEETAAFHLRNTEYYQGVLDQIGNIIGEEAFIQDDGGRVDSVLRAKLPELVQALKESD